MRGVELCYQSHCFRFDITTNENWPTETDCFSKYPTSPLKCGAREDTISMWKMTCSVPGSRAALQSCCSSRLHVRCVPVPTMICRISADAIYRCTLCCHDTSLYVSTHLSEEYSIYSSMKNIAAPARIGSSSSSSLFRAYWRIRLPKRTSRLCLVLLCTAHHIRRYCRASCRSGYCAFPCVNGAAVRSY